MENPSNIIPDQLIVLDGDAGLVPKAEPADAGKVLGVLNASGDVGWVVDQSGTFIQQQSNWSETDSSKVTYIENKPDLSVYATTNAMNTALAGKQNVIEDLSDIRSGAAAGATAAQPSDLPSSDELVPSATSGDAGKVLTVGNDGTASWVTPSAGTVYTPGDGIAIDNNDVISADVDNTTIGIDSTTKKIKLLSTIPAAQVNSDWNAVSGVAQILNKPTIPSVDQTYNSASTNAQSGTAVAGALATVNQVPASTSSDENKVLTVDSNGDAGWQNVPTPSVDEVPAVTSSDDGKVLTASYSGGAGSYSWQTPQGGGGSTPTWVTKTATLNMPYFDTFDSSNPLDPGVYLLNVVITPMQWRQNYYLEFGGLESNMFSRFSGSAVKCPFDNNMHQGSSYSASTVVEITSSTRYGFVMQFLNDSMQNVLPHSDDVVTFSYAKIADLPS